MAADFFDAGLFTAAFLVVDFFAAAFLAGCFLAAVEGAADDEVFFVVREGVGGFLAAPVVLARVVFGALFAPVGDDDLGAELPPNIPAAP